MASPALLPQPNNVERFPLIHWTSNKATTGTPDTATWEQLLDFVRNPVEATDKNAFAGWSPVVCEDNRRRKEYVKSISLLVLDSDDGSFDAAQWSDLAGVAHTSFSHTPEHPKYRIVLRTSRPMTPAEHARVWQHVRDIVTARGQKLDESTKDPSRLWYVPARQPGAPYEVVELAGQVLDVDAVLAQAPANKPIESVRPGLVKTQGSADVLDVAAGMLADSAPPPGRRNDWRMALAGMCRDMNFTEADALDFMRRAHARLAINASSEGELAAVARATYSKESGSKRTGATRLGELTNAAVVSAARDLLNGLAEFKARLAANEAKLTITGESNADAPEIESKAAPGFTFVSSIELAKPLPPVPYLFRYFGIAPGRPAELSGYGGIGKTLIAQHIELCVSAGLTTCWGLPIASGAVRHFDYEMTRNPLQLRFQREARGLGIDLRACDLAVTSMPSIYLSDAAAEDALCRACDGITLGVIDNLAAACATSSSRENEASIRIYLDRLTRVTAKTGCCFLVLAHERKSSKDEGSSGLQRVRGSSAITDAAGSVVSVVGGEGQGILTLRHEKASLGPKAEDFFVQIVDLDEKGEVVSGSPPGDEWPGLRVQAVEAPAVSARSAEIQSKIKDLLVHGPVETQRKIEDMIKAKRGTVGPELKVLTVRREVTFIKGRGYCLDYPVQRRERVVAAVTGSGLTSPTQVARAAYVDTDDVAAMIRERVIVRQHEPDGPFMARPL